MRPMRQSAQITNSPLRQAIRQVFAPPLLTGSLLIALAPAAQGLTLGDISVRSTLGQRLNASVPVRLGAGEALASGCVIPGYRNAELRAVPGADVTTPQAAREGLYELQVTSAAALYEPMYALELKVQCPGAPILVRQYVLMLDLPAAVASAGAAAYEPAAMPVPATGLRQDPVAQSVALPTSTLNAQPRPVQRHRVSSPPGATIEPGTRYRVAEGDTLSAIAARVRSRSVSLWTLAQAIQTANPEAFIRNDPNLIKLGSEILIPAGSIPEATPGTAPKPALVAAPAPIPVPATVVPAVMATEPAQPVESVQPAPAQAAMVPAPVPAAAVAPVPSRKPVAQRTVIQEPAVATTANVDEPNPVIAAGAGILFGLCVSGMLWLRGRRQPGKRSAPLRPGRDTEAPLPFATPAPAAATATMPIPLVTQALEPSFTVSYTPPADDTLAEEFARDDVTSELEELFDSTDTTIQKRLNAEKTMAAQSLGSNLQDDCAPLPANRVNALDDEDATREARTVDIGTLATSATNDEKQAQTLLEALTLLERDYEEELTASQVLDMSAVREALGNDFDEPTHIRATQIREASARKRTR